MRVWAAPTADPDTSPVLACILGRQGGLWLPTRERMLTAETQERHLLFLYFDCSVVASGFFFLFHWIFFKIFHLLFYLLTLLALLNLLKLFRTFKITLSICYIQLLNSKILLFSLHIFLRLLFLLFCPHIFSIYLYLTLHFYSFSLTVRVSFCCFTPQFAPCVSFVFQSVL